MGKRITKADEHALQLAAVCSALEAAAVLGISDERVKQLCRAGRIASKLLGRDWVLSRAAVLQFASVHRPSGRPAANQRTGKVAKNAAKTPSAKNS